MRRCDVDRLFVVLGACACLTIYMVDFGGKGVVWVTFEFGEVLGDRHV